MVSKWRKVVLQEKSSMKLEVNGMFMDSLEWHRMQFQAWFLGISIFYFYKFKGYY